MPRIIDLFAANPSNDSYADVARREAYANALRELAARPRGPAPGGRVQAKYGIGEGLTQLAEALLAGRAGRQAIDARKSADDAASVQNERIINDLTMDHRPQKIDAQGQPIPGTEPQQMLNIDTGRPELSARGQALSRAVAGQDPQQIRQFLMQQQLSRLLPDPSQVADRDLKRMQIEGGLRDRADARQQRMLELEMRLSDRGLDREARAAAAAELAALRREIASGQQQTQRDIAGMRVDAQTQKTKDKAEVVAQSMVAGSNAADGIIAQLRSSYNELEKSGGITDPNAGALSNVGAAIKSSGPGQFVGRVFGTLNQSERNKIAQSRPILLAALKEATGMSARQLDSNAELKLWLSAATDPQLDIEANRAALANIENFIAAKSGRAAVGAVGVGGTATEKTVVRTGTMNGRKVIQYSDGTTDYAD